VGKSAPPVAVPTKNRRTAMFSAAAARIIVGAAAVIAAATMSLPAIAEYPERPVKIVVPYQAGGATDILARLLAQKLSEEFKRSFIVENKTGAAGMIGVTAVATAPADGYTILVDAPGVVLNPSLYRKISYDPKDLQPVAKLIEVPFVIITNPNVPIRNVTDLADYARKNAGKFNVASAGNSTQLAGEVFRLMANVEFTFVPYKGAAPAGLSVVSGETEVMFSDLTSVAQLIKGGRLRAIAVAGERRSPMLPEVPTARETGMPDYVVSQWFGALVPAATPPDIVRQLNTAINRVIMQPDFVAALANLGAEPVASSVEGFTKFYRDELVRWKDVVARAKMPLSD
jgi:tripartite-type tricarboxylate transporter receptor subunit TctC